MIAYIIISSNAIVNMFEVYSSINVSFWIKISIKCILTLSTIFPLTFLKDLKILNKASFIANLIILTYSISMLVYLGLTISG